MEAVGIGVLLVGATGAAVVVPRLRASGRSRFVPYVLAAAGAVVGAGAALVRDFDVLPTAAVGALLFPLFGLVVRRRGAPS